ncbi:hypothetical protein [Halobacillus naozhouensis]|uniref:Uncharacterized protein n=1 Tax=Halobacillus naozhouensis TaxID=554880 RepID=A0ABY8J3Z0_9BACI|nr:hypothetical protein [Halobacillus naozhouensis]WFT77095.1 hypothetical protein P9989_21550 [Halobacillus naozhouensis]
MSLNARLNKMEKGLQSKARERKEEKRLTWQERMERDKELEELEPLVHQGDLEACIRYCRLSEEHVIDRLYSYRDVFIKLAEGSKADLKGYNSLDVWYENLKATYMYLGAKEKDPETTFEPVLLSIQIPDDE